MRTFRKNVLLFSVAFCLSSSLAGCLSPIAMHQAVLAYDKTVTQVNSEQLLLNIVRARHHRPVHFTTVSSVAATFDFRVSGGIAPPEGEARGLVAPVFSATVSENPTITIVPMGGAEFTRRLLTPMDETRFLSILQHGADMGMILRMMVSAMRLDSENGRDVLANEPGKTEEYEEFRRRSLHLSFLHEAHQLHIEPIMFEEVWAGALDRSPEPEDVLRALEKAIGGRLSATVDTPQPNETGHRQLSTEPPSAG